MISRFSQLARVTGADVSFDILLHSWPEIVALNKLKDSFDSWVVEIVVTDLEQLFDISFRNN